MKHKLQQSRSFSNDEQKLKTELDKIQFEVEFYQPKKA